MVNPRVNTFSYTAFTYIPFRITIFILGLVQCLGQIMKDPSMDFLTCFCHSLSFTPYILKSAFFLWNVLTVSVRLCSTLNLLQPTDLVFLTALMSSLALSLYSSINWLLEFREFISYFVSNFMLQKTFIVPKLLKPGQWHQLFYWIHFLFYSLFNVFLHCYEFTIYLENSSHGKTLEEWIHSFPWWACVVFCCFKLEI